MIPVEVVSSIEAERGVLGSILLEGRDVFDEVAALLRPADFFVQAHAVVYREIEGLAGDGRPIDLVTLSDRLEKAGQFVEVGGNDFLAGLVQSVPHSVNARAYADLVKQKSTARQLSLAADKILGDLRSNRFDAEALLDRAEARVFAVGAQGRGDEAVSSQSAIEESEQLLRQRRDGIIPGLPTGFDDFDERIGGLHPGQLVVLAARPSIGKSAWALNVAENIALKRGVSTLFVSLEMTRVELSNRMVCGLAGVDNYRFMHADRLSDDELHRIENSIAILKPMPLFIDDAPGRTIGEISSMARRYRSRHQIGLLVVDYLQLVEVDSGGRGVSRQEQIALMSRRFKMLAKALDIPVLVLSQLNRNAEGREDKRPHMADIRESGAVEQDANVILLLHRPEFYDPNEMPGMAELIVAKNRDGQTGIVRLKFEKAITRFSTHHDVDPAIF